MEIQDRVYKTIIVDEPVIAEVIESAPMQRLKKISQDGPPHLIQPQRNVNRFEHSVGVWYLSKLFNRPIEEQLACLIHDVPHTAFSHVIDFVVEDERHEYHERFTEKIIKESEVPEILKRQGVDLDVVLEKHRYPLLENDLPDISFDRWDYFMRDGFMFGLLPQLFVDEFISGVKERDGRLYFPDMRLASSFAILFMSFSRLIWLDPTSHGAFLLFAKALKRALELGVISEDDFFTDDETVMQKLQSTNDDEIRTLLEKLSPGKEFSYASESESDYYSSNKPRFVDPLVEVEGELVRLSDKITNFKEYFSEFATNYKMIGVKQNL
ncbi:HD domain-containing protein [candidate division WWE3 bacterium]|uniref:HD domain-containing protein n=1 Tax=candidate division WWE3 bacterium TaxID=2053526 RepID=A0A955LK27_UNCKA|nr:HD domain-containing protein [candidate division WWE3 bacterium]